MTMLLLGLLIGSIAFNINTITRCKREVERRVDREVRDEIEATDRANSKWLDAERTRHRAEIRKYQAAISTLIAQRNSTRLALVYMSGIHGGMTPSEINDAINHRVPLP